MSALTFNQRYILKLLELEDTMLLFTLPHTVLLMYTDLKRFVNCVVTIVNR